MRANTFFEENPTLWRPLARVYSLILAASKRRAAESVAENESFTQPPAIPAEVASTAELGIAYEYLNVQKISGGNDEH